MRNIRNIIIAGLLIAAPASAYVQSANGGMAEASATIVKTQMSQRNAALAPLLARKDVLQKQFDALITPVGYDDAKLASTMAEMRAVEGQIVETMGTSLLALLKALPDADRALFMQSMTRTPPNASAAVATPLPIGPPSDGPGR